jgi:predicted DsbA family dithiol-disulfide isomerase
MKLKILIVYCLILAFVKTPVFADLSGKYDIIVPNIPPVEHSLDKIRIDEVFSFTCSHCYNFHKNAVFLEKIFGDKIEIHSIPIGWGGHNPGKLFYIAEEANKGHQVKARIFEFAFDREKGGEIYKMDVLRGVAIVEGVQNFFDEKMDSPEITKKMKAGIRLADISKIDSTPTIVIERSIKTSGDIKNLVTVINSLLKEPVKEPYLKFKQFRQEAKKKTPVTKSRQTKKTGFWQKVTGLFN